MPSEKEVKVDGFAERRGHRSDLDMLVKAANTYAWTFPVCFDHLREVDQQLLSRRCLCFDLCFAIMRDMTAHMMELRSWGLDLNARSPFRWSWTCLQIGAGKHKRLAIGKLRK